MKTFLCALMTISSLVAAPQAVVFDYGGVMTGRPNREAVVKFLRVSFQLSEAEFETANLAKRQAIESGKSDEAFWLEYAKEKKINLPADWTKQFKSVLKDGMGINPEMYALVDRLKEKHIPIALLSNIDERLAKLIREFGWYEPFQPCLLSYELGVDKPDPKAYKILLERLNLPPQDVVFIDDRAENIEAAKKLGIDAILFESLEQLSGELKKRELL